MIHNQRCAAGVIDVQIILYMGLVKLKSDTVGACYYLRYIRAWSAAAVKACLANKTTWRQIDDSKNIDEAKCMIQLFVYMYTEGIIASSLHYIRIHVKLKHKHNPLSHKAKAQNYKKHKQRHT